MRRAAADGMPRTPQVASDDGCAGKSTDKTILLLDDDEAACELMARALAERGFRPVVTNTCEAAIAAIDADPPAFALVETNLAAGSSLGVVERLRDARPDCTVVVLTAYASIPLAVAAVRAGAIDVLPKPADPDFVVGVLMAAPNDESPPALERLTSAARVRWEHITRIYELCDHNVSLTARRLNMHRHTLQRILGRRAPP